MNTDEKDRPIVLAFIHYYLPGYKSGGPIRTIANMVEALGDSFDFRIVTSDRDATDTEPYPDVTDGVWKTVGKAQVLYLSPQEKSLGHIARVLRDTQHDVLYLNSFFDPDFTQKPLLARRLGLAPRTHCVIAPRGEFSESALRLKPLKKRAYMLAARVMQLYRGLKWQASSEHEEADIRRTLGSVAKRIKIAINLPETVINEPPLFVPSEQGEPLRICFLSRISPMKNLDFALKVLGEVRAPVRFDIYGPVSDEGYWLHCRKLMEDLPANVETAWFGGVEHEHVTSILAGYHLFFLPTQGENYGHVIHEALAAGTPVLIADTTPWRNLADACVGWDLPLGDPQKFAEKIEYIARMTADEDSRMRASSVSFARKRIVDAGSLEANMDLFRKI
ncbi:glycosyltransferase family 4 protein [Aquamicrobium defluvii]|uniref:Glycosyltransferase involved in cell wall biosynthesis n=1 Tax=Aquamicrobium defluvii TaxID=69279 RepID=A0A011UV51_9HYPH|nr:glycosyltransferase family 4 protein [Aquamicrobium defluvii]EXL10141.1 group 1 family glycosyltransferase [Aquamicrobium defluvii]EZQ16917.1 group 1 family glycosyltransferase [Halopseudomonas bauzanensis]TDR36473.1 glycosyltransferase involved in cell wall biosynthesis [Aquamicrobium defluvii]